jgi:hypothetical protein
VATFADGTAAALASDLLSAEWQATMLAITGNINPAAKIKEASFRMSSVHLLNRIL